MLKGQCSAFFILLKPISSRVLEHELSQHDRTRARTWFTFGRVELKHRNRAHHELELEPNKKKIKPSSNRGYLLKIGSIIPLPLKLTPIRNSDTNVSIASIAAHKVQEIYNSPIFVQLLPLMKWKWIYMRGTWVFWAKMEMPSSKYCVLMSLLLSKFSQNWKKEKKMKGVGCWWGRGVVRRLGGKRQS